MNGDLIAKGKALDFLAELLGLRRRRRFFFFRESDDSLRERCLQFLYGQKVYVGKDGYPSTHPKWIGGIMKAIKIRLITFTIGLVMMPFLLVFLAFAAVFVLLIPIIGVIAPDSMKYKDKPIRKVFGL